jgi:hypothetical protein
VVPSRCTSANPTCSAAWCQLCLATSGSVLGELIPRYRPRHTLKLLASQPHAPAEVVPMPAPHGGTQRPEAGSSTPPRAQSHEQVLAFK